MQYRSNNQDTIRGIFSLEGDSLARHGFAEPADLRRLGDDALPQVEVIAVDQPVLGELGGMTGEHLAAYRKFLEIGEIAYEG